MISVVKTDQRIGEMGRRIGRRRAEHFAAKYAPIFPSYHTRVEKIGPFLYAIVAYQNLASTEEPS